MLSDPGLGIYKKLVIADGRLVGAVLFGDTADGLWYLDLIRSGADIDGDPRRSRLRPRARGAHAGARTQDGGVTCPAISLPSRNATSKASCPASTRRARRAARCRRGKSEPAGPDAIHFKAQDRVTAAGGKLADQEKFKREQHPFDAYDRLKEQAEKNEPPKPADNFRWRYYGLFYVAPAQSSYMCRLRIPNGILKHWQFAGRRRPRGALRRALCACDDARQPADPRDRAEARGRGGRRHREPRPVVARLRRRQHPQRHRHADRRHRPAGADRHAALCARMALPHPQRPRALRPAAQVQCRLRRRRHHSGAGGHQRHRLPGGRGDRRASASSRASGSASRSAASPDIATSRATPA